MTVTYEGGSKRFPPDIQKARQIENAARDIQVSQEERTKLREGVPYVKLYRYNPKHLCPKLNGFRDNGK